MLKKKTLLLATFSLALGIALPQLFAQTAPAPAAATIPADAITPTTRIALFNSKDVTGWQIFLGTTATVPNTAPASEPSATAPKVWSVADGILKLDTKSAGYLRSDKAYANYHLHVEWRWPKDANTRSNSGVLVHLNGESYIWPACYECQLQTGNAGQVVGQGLDIPDAPLQNSRKRAPRLATTTEKPLGEWNSYDILAIADTLDVSINGKPANKVTKLPVRSGAIALQLEGYPIEFQNVYVEPLPETK